MRIRLHLLASIFFAGLAGIACPLVLGGCRDGYYDDEGSSIIFGVSQRVDAKTGAVETTAGYEFLELANQSGGWATQYLRDDRSDTKGACWFERFDQRLGQPRVEGGVATFRGAALPGPGIQVFANQKDETKLASAGWKTGDILFFDAQGFAMPAIPTVRIAAPAAELAISEPAAPGPEAPPLTLRPNDDVKVAWTTADEQYPSRVMVALDTEEPNGRGGGVRCFYPAEDGGGVIGHAWIAKLFDSAEAQTPGGTKKGTLEIASHRQVTIWARGGWTVYVVATTMHRQQPFVSAPTN